MSGDIYDGSLNQNAHLYYDGVDQGAVAPLAGPATFTLPVVPGNHTVELWIGASPNNAGLTVPSVTFSFANVVGGGSLPCDCCPAGPPRCALTAVRFDAVAETTAQAGWNRVSLASTADGITSTAVQSGYNSPAGTTPSTTLRITYTISPQNRVRGLRLWNQGGSILTDSDGLGQFTAEFYAGATLLATATFLGANGAGPQTFTLPSQLELNGVDSVVLRDLGKLIPGTVSPLWRELQLLEFQTVFPCRRRSGTLEWYDVDGDLVVNADVMGCQVPPQPFLMPDLHLAGAAFGDDPTGTAENVCTVTPAPSATSGWTFTNPCYDPVTGAPTMDWGPTTSVELEFGSGAVPAASGGVFFQFSSPTLAPSGITWPVNPVQMAPGETWLSNVFGGGHRAILTYVSGPSQNSSAGTIRAEGGVNLGVHRLAVSTVAQIRFRLDFVTT
ncbi:hypothetical protein [Streptomyces sp. NPDC059063]|uniref:hypothetical protein n=1 Tax=Streptomyces sp. NPDC059063 TaxID=3346712 RepID=UPI0036CBACB5